MLEMRPACENCAKPLPNESEEAMICTFECTFCATCVQKVLLNVCPNCGGGFEKRPSRPKELLLQYPVSKKNVFKTVDQVKFMELQNKMLNIDPRKR